MFYSKDLKDWNYFLIAGRVGSPNIIKIGMNKSQLYEN